MNSKKTPIIIVVTADPNSAFNTAFIANSIRLIVITPNKIPIVSPQKRAKIKPTKTGSKFVNIPPIEDNEENDALIIPVDAYIIVANPKMIPL